MDNDEDLGLYSALINVHIRAESRQVAVDVAERLTDHVLNDIPDALVESVVTARFSPFELTEMIVPATSATA
jgi:hypothetical protein